MNREEQHDRFRLKLTANKESKSLVHHFVSDLYTLSLLAGERSLHHAVVFSQQPAPVYQLGIKYTEGREGVGSQSVFLRLWGPLGVVDVENHISFGHVKVPGDDRGSLRDLDQQLQKDVRK